MTWRHLQDNESSCCGCYIKNRFIAVRDTLCYCSICFTGKNEAANVNSKCEWKKVMISPSGNESLEIIPGYWVICESKWDVGQVL